MSTTYDRLRTKFVEQTYRRNARKAKAAAILDGAIDRCVQKHGVPEGAITCHPRSEEISEGKGWRQPIHEITEQRNGSWSVNIVLQIGTPNDGAWMHGAVRPEIRFTDAGIELGIVDDTAKIILRENEDPDVSLTAYAALIMKYFESGIELLDQPEDRRGRVIGFHAAPQTASAIPKHPSPLP